MTSKRYERVLADARRDLKRAYREREELDRQIAKLRQVVIATSGLTDDAEFQQFKEWVPRAGKLTQVVQSTLIASSTPMSATEVRSVLEDLGYRFQTSNPLGSIHSVIVRLIEQKSIAKVRLTRPDGKAIGSAKFWPASFEPPPSWVNVKQLKWDKARNAWIVDAKEESARG